MDHPSLICLDGHTIAYRRHDGAGPTVVWLGGFKSDLTGTKAAHLHGGARTLCAGGTQVKVNGPQAGIWVAPCAATTTGRF